MINMTQHPPTPEQVQAGVLDSPEFREEVSRLLTVETLPSWEEISDRAKALANLAYDAREGRFGGFGAASTRVMIGGAPWMMAPLERALQAQGFTPFYAFSVRESVESTQPDGSVRKTAVFHHIGFIEGVAA